MKTRGFNVSSALQLDPAMRCTTAQAPLVSLGEGGLSTNLSV